MKNAILFTGLFALLFPQMVFSQAKKTSDQKTKLSNLYLSFGIPISQYGGGSAGIAMLLSNDFGTSISWNIIDKKAKNTPSNYSNCCSSSGKCRGPTDNIYSISLRLIKEFPTLDKNLRYGFEGGPSFIRYIETEFKSIPNNSGLTNPGNYSKTRIEKKTLGLSLKAKLKFPLTNVLGFELAANLNINQIRTFTSIGIHMMLGKVRERI